MDTRRFDYVLDMSDPEKQAAEIIKKIIYASVATVSENGQPWNSPVYTAYDKDLNFYWTSTKDAQHSKNIRTNQEVFLVIYNAKAPEGTGRGVYFIADAMELKNVDDIKIARHYTQARKGQTAGDPDRFLGKSLRRVYKAQIIKGWTNGGESTPKGYRDFRVELNMKKLRKYLK